MTKYNNILNLFSLGLVLIILFIIIYGCQFRIYKNKIEKFTNPNDENDDNDENNNDNNDNDNNNDNNNDSENIDEDNINDDKNKKKLDNNEYYLLEQFINDKFSEEEVNKLILEGKFTKDNLEHLIDYIENISKKNKND